LFKLHSRIEQTLEDALCVQYLRAAVAATENRLSRDVFPTTRTFSGTLDDGRLHRPGCGYTYGCACPTSAGWGHVPFFDFARGRARSVAVTVNTGDPPAPVPVPIDQYTVVQPAGDKAAGCRITSPTLGACDVTITSGWANSAELPDDLRQFILVAAGAHYEVRELANYQQAVQDADFLPTYLLDSWAQLSFA
jgi:hypothetical protein